MKKLLITVSVLAMLLAVLSGCRVANRVPGVSAAVSALPSMPTLVPTVSAALPGVSPTVAASLSPLTTSSPLASVSPSATK